MRLSGCVSVRRGAFAVIVPNAVSPKVLKKGVAKKGDSAALDTRPGRAEPVIAKLLNHHRSRVAPNLHFAIQRDIGSFASKSSIPEVGFHCALCGLPGEH